MKVKQFQLNLYDLYHIQFSKLCLFILLICLEMHFIINRKLVLIQKRFIIIFIYFYQSFIEGILFLYDVIVDSTFFRLQKENLENFLASLM